jgi:hypothetical protein
MKMKMPEVKIRVDLEDMTPAESGEVASILEKIGDFGDIRVHWYNDRTIAVLMFNDLEAFETFQRLRPPAEFI